MGKNDAYSGFWSVTWLNPYTKPPEGMPIRLAGPVEIKNWAANKEKKPPKELEIIAAANPGYVVTWEPEYIAKKKWSRKAKAKNRLRRLRLRAEKKCPLFADEYIRKEIAKKPLYFEARDPRFDIQERS
ncbi:MAG: hypothetical protein JRH08_00640 [Deltaproteobacteria bacterium]|nr:hypothetical protein [Deltaproteobacteria bacterium]MBW2124210.1 hypothetical protein [Deltaproteobacteria bacterium]